jgi:hypothetical protein
VRNKRMGIRAEEERKPAARKSALGNPSVMELEAL